MLASVMSVPKLWLVGKIVAAMRHASGSSEEKYKDAVLHPNCSRAEAAGKHAPDKSKNTSSEDVLPLIVENWELMCPGLPGEDSGSSHSLLKGVTASCLEVSCSVRVCLLLPHTVPLSSNTSHT